MKTDFTKIKVLDIGDKPITDFHKVLARVIFMHTQNLDLVEIARAMNKGESVELRDSDFDELKRIVNSREANIFAFARKATLDFIEEQKGKKDGLLRQQKDKN
jgi:hypothetical protein